MALREKLYTFEEFWEIVMLPENVERRLELDEGIIVDMGSSSPTNTVIAMRMGYFLNAFVIPNDLGYVTGADGGFRLAPKTFRIPDVGFISKQRVSTLPKRFEIAPDLAVEIVSPDEDVFRKANEYIEAGTQMVWAVYASEKRVYIFRPNQDGTLNVQTYNQDDTLDGGDVLPGFTLRVSDIFPA